MYLRSLKNIKTIMHLTTVKYTFVAFLVHLMCVTVVLSHIHAKDTVSAMSQQSNLSKLASTDITAKALGDLHQHIDKTGLKNIHVDPTTAARTRELQPLEALEERPSLAVLLQDFLLRFRVVSSLIVRQSFA